MRKFTSLDVYFVLKELKFLIDAKIDKIYQDRDDFILSFHKGGKHLLKIEPNIIHLTDFKSFETEPNNFCMFLRKHLGQGRLRKIKQENFERVVEFHIDCKEKYILIFELFSKGNLILCDKDYKILYPLHSKRFKDRVVKRGEKYVYPPSSFKGFEGFKLADKNLVKTLALDYGLGGLYSEEICLRAGIDKNFDDLGEADLNKIRKTINEILKLKIKANEVGVDVYPFELKLFENEKKKYFGSFSKAVESLEAIDNPYNNQIKKVMNILEKQKLQVDNLKRIYEENKGKGDLIYVHYAKIEGILNEVRGLRDKKISFDEISKKIHAKVENGKILLDLE